MSIVLRQRRARPSRRTVGYRQILVPLGLDAVSELAVDLACRLAADDGAAIRVLTVIEVPELLPLDAAMPDEEQVVHGLLLRANAVADTYGIRIATQTIRAREAGSVIAERAETLGCDLILMGQGSRPRSGAGRTATFVLKHATCRVMLVRGTP